MTLLVGSKADIAPPYRTWVGRVSPGSLPTPPCKCRASERRPTAKLRSPARRFSHFPTTPGRAPRPARSLAPGSTGAFRLTTAPDCPCLDVPPGLTTIGPRRISPQPLLRLADTMVGIAVGVACKWAGSFLFYKYIGE